MSINNLITIEQFGFRTGHSTELAAIQLVDHLRGSTAIRHSTNYNFFIFFYSKTCLFSFETSFMTY